MKKNLSLLIATIAFVALFYKQTPALNLSLLSLLAWLLLFLTLRPRYKTKTFWLLSLATLVSTVSFAWYGDFLSFVALFFSLSFTGYTALYSKMNIITIPVSAFINYSTFICRAPILSTWMPEAKWSRGGFMKKLVTYFIIPSFFLFLFIWVYSAGSNKFASYFIIDWNVDILQILGLSLLGFFLMFCFFHFYVPKFMIRFNTGLKDDFSKIYSNRNTTFKFFDLSAQRRSGEVTMVLLNLLLIFFITIYSIEQFGEMSSSGSLSGEVHERVYVLVFSIVLAIVLIMIYFNGMLNFDKKILLLKVLSIIWICLNIVLVAVVVAKNIQYVQAFGLTFKRISLFIFLLLSVAGLLTTYHKLVFKKTNVFLLNRMFWITFIVLLVSAVINWSWIVTKHNIKYQKTVDWAYLYSLDYNKQLLYDKDEFEHSPESGYGLSKQIKREKEKKLLSKNLYYEFLKVK